MPETSATMRLHDNAGRRLYLTASERARFLVVARSKPLPVSSLCLTLAYTCCRVSEALALSPDHLDAESGGVVIQSLKKRRAGHIRELPIPGELVVLLSELSRHNRRFWPVSRATAWRRIKEVMREAHIAGPQASPKGVRHTFAVHAVMQQVPPGILQKWMGHADLSTTAIYTQLCGAEERVVAERMW